MSKHTRTRLPEGTAQVRNASTGEVKQVGDIKMNKVFHLPMECASSKDYTGIQCTELADNDFFLADFRGEWSLEKANEMAEAAVHAINNHDKLTSRVTELEGALEAIIINQEIMAGDSSFMLDKLTCYQIANNALNPISD